MRNSAPDLYPVDDLKRTHRVTLLIWGAMAASLFVYALVAELVGAARASLPAPSLGVLRWVFVGLAVAQFAVVGLVARRLLEGRAALPAGPLRPAQRLQGAAILRFAMCEAVGLYGLVLFFLGGSRRDLYAFVVVALIALAVHVPRRERWEEWARAEARRA